MITFQAIDVRVCDYAASATDFDNWVQTGEGRRDGIAFQVVTPMVALHPFNPRKSFAHYVPNVTESPDIVIPATPRIVPLHSSYQQH